MAKQAYIGIKYYEDNRNQSEIARLSRQLEQAGYTTVCIARDVEKWGTVRVSPQELMQRTFTIIDQSDLIVMEMSEKGVGLGIEAGYAYAKGKYLLIVLQKERELSSTMAGIATKIIRYNTLEQLDLTTL
ncbi:MAG: nucleoside 2-deoxyribosyltransferase [Ardenticatenaceae bacterium]|nr:nucleoside 2-deoxyribosyltransferase [Ardenticatenaceae bacterium]